jgi:nitroreductase
VHLLVLEGDSLARFWRTTEGDTWFEPEIVAAPTMVIALADPDTYTSRYSETDKQGHGLEDASNWPVPFWITDAAMAVQNLLLLAESRGIGALYFGLFNNARLALDELGVPAHVLALGAVLLGHRAADDRQSGSAATRTRRPTTEVVHWSSW